MVEESLVQWWLKWAKQVVELQVLRVDAESRRKEGDGFYKMDADNVVTIREELADNFVSLADEQLVAVQRLVEQLGDDQLDNQLQFERYERERRRQEAARRTVAINISDKEQSPEQTSNVAGTRGGQPNKAQVEQPNVANPKEPVEAGRQQQEEPKPKEPRPVEPERNGAGKEEQDGSGERQQQREQQQQQTTEQLPDKPLEPLDQSILDILEDDWKG